MVEEGRALRWGQRRLRNSQELHLYQNIFTAPVWMGAEAFGWGFAFGQATSEAPGCREAAAYTLRVCVKGLVGAANSWDLAPLPLCWQWLLLGLLTGIFLGCVLSPFKACRSRRGSSAGSRFSAFDRSFHSQGTSTEPPLEAYCVATQTLPFEHHADSHSQTECSAWRIHNKSVQAVQESSSVRVQAVVETVSRGPSTGEGEVATLPLTLATTATGRQQLAVAPTEAVFHASEEDQFGRKPRRQRKQAWICNLSTDSL